MSEMAQIRARGDPGMRFFAQLTFHPNGVRPLKRAIHDAPKDQLAFQKIPELVRRDSLGSRLIVFLAPLAWQLRWPVIVVVQQTLCSTCPIIFGTALCSVYRSAREPELKFGR